MIQYLQQSMGYLRKEARGWWKSYDPRIQCTHDCLRTEGRGWWNSYPRIHGWQRVMVILEYNDVHTSIHGLSEDRGQRLAEK